MGKVNVYLPDDLERAARDAGISISAVAQAAVRSVLDTVAALEGDAPADAFARTRIAPRFAEVLADLEHDAATSGREVTAHDLLGAILRRGDTIGGQTLRNLGVELPPDAAPSRRGRKQRRARTYAADARDRLVAAVHVALDMRHNYVGTEHLVIALAEDGSPLQDIFHALGIDGAMLRAEVERLLRRPTATSATAARRPPPAELVARFESELQRLADELVDFKQRFTQD